jgi:hypothetical protein
MPDSGDSIFSATESASQSSLSVHNDTDIPTDCRMLPETTGARVQRRPDMDTTKESRRVTEYCAASQGATART